MKFEKNVLFPSGIRKQKPVESFKLFKVRHVRAYNQAVNPPPARISKSMNWD